MNDSTDRKADDSSPDTNAAKDSGISWARAERPMIPGGLRLLALAVIVVGSAWLLMKDDSPPTLEPQPVGDEEDGYRLVTGRVTPPEAEELSNSFVPVTGMLREQVLQRLSELKAEWRVAGPRVLLYPYDVQGDAVAFAEQLETWLEQNNLLAGETVATRSDGSDAGGNDAADDGSASSGDATTNGSSQGMSAQNVVEGDLPPPPAPGLVIRARSDDMAIARDLALALAPVIGGEVNVLSDERVNARHIVVALVGAPRFSDDGVAYFQDQ